MDVRVTIDGTWQSLHGVVAADHCW